MPNDDLITRADEWQRHDPDPGTAEQLRGMIDRRELAALEDCVGSTLAFGTAGLRGVLGAGPGRMNRAVVRRSTKGLVQYLRRTVGGIEERGVVVGYDARRLGAELAREVAGVLAGCGVPALVTGQTITPFVSFATLQLGAAAGVMITASHNPPEYNGLKVYWENGVQIAPPHDAGIAAEIARAAFADAIACMGEEQARARGLWRAIPLASVDGYFAASAGHVLHPGRGREVRIVYSPLHGTGGLWAMRALKAAGFDDVVVVAEQAQPDGAFPTVRFPNPEERGVLDRSLRRARAVDAELVLVNDPDADRLAVAVKRGEADYRVLTGNEVGVLLGHYLLGERPQGPRRPLVVSTIVSSPQLGVIARDLGAEYEETLTGFKWIMNRALERCALEGLDFVFGYEEAIGYAIGSAVRDKDGVSAAAVLADLAGWCRAQGFGVLDYLAHIQRQHGLFLSDQRSMICSGSGAQEILAEAMGRFRARAPDAIGALAVRERRDYLRGIGALPAADVLAFVLEDGSRITLRPSGTEPKIKYYFDVRDSLRPGERFDEAARRGAQRLRSLVDGFLALAQDGGAAGGQGSCLPVQGLEGREPI
jgi:phosphomannomutase